MVCLTYSSPPRQGGLVGWQGLLEAENDRATAGWERSGDETQIFENLSKICLCERDLPKENLP